ncbi:MAG: hypothetical protein K9K63_03780 [Desulfotignum sp.]|nr:hypothetical protein [Desulfotignum sp.]MCF8088678.1 hypothetical protein [Desulfotignum sp.]MCF8136408.1 hypothetical protein [Desulfotignum sp.]
MEFVVGAPQPIGPPGKRLPNQPQVVEARILNVRPPRRGPRSLAEKQDNRRGRSQGQDPASGRVMVVLVPEGYYLPADIDSGNYRVFLRFVPQKKAG